MQCASHSTTYKYYCNFLSLLFYCHGIQSGNLFLFLCPLPFFLWSQAALHLSCNSHLRTWHPCFVETLTCPLCLMSTTAWSTVCAPWKILIKSGQWKRCVVSAHPLVGHHVLISLLTVWCLLDTGCAILLRRSSVLLHNQTSMHCVRLALLTAPFFIPLNLFTPL